MNDNPVLRLGPFKVPESNVFLMTRFRSNDYNDALSAAVADAVRAFGLELVRADDPDIHETELWRKVKFCMDACHFGVATFDAIDQSDFNPNVSMELGYMMALKRDYLLLKERKLKGLHADLCGHLYREFDSANVRPTVFAQIADWLKSNEVRKRDRQKLIVFVSYGGQDRCAIAKVITRDLLEKNGVTIDFRIESRAAFNTAGATAARTGIEVVQSRLGKDWLGSHRPRRAGPAFLFEADLILATDRDVLSKLQNSFESYPGSDEDRTIVRDEIQNKSDLLSTFLGGTGDITDPFPDHGDDDSRRKYEDCFDDLYRRISNGLPVLIKFLERDDPPKAKLRTVNFGDRRLFGASSLP